MKRWHEESNRTFREWKKHWRSHIQSNLDHSMRGIGKDPYEVECICDKQKGRFRKKKDLDCGNPRCHMCHSDKFPKRKLTRRESEANLKLREQSSEQSQST
jgi:hypothetical protein